MRDVDAEAGHLRIVFHHDDKTPVEFIIDLLHSVFNKPPVEALRFTAKVDQRGRAVCGTYPSDVAKELLEAARQRIRLAAHPLKITSEAVGETGGQHDGYCKLCGAFVGDHRLALTGAAALVCDGCMYEITSGVSETTRTREFEYACDALGWHFVGIPRDQLTATSRQFPGHMRADVQVAVERLFSASPIRFFGIHEQHRYETLTIAALTINDDSAPAIAPAQYYDVDIGESAPVKCLNNGLWLCQTDSLRYAVVLSSHREYGREAGTRIEIAVPAGEVGAEFVQRCFSELESAVSAARSYRGKILSLDASAEYHGRSRGVTVHKLPSVRREDVVLPEATLKLLDRNVLNFVGSRAHLRRLGQSTRKGIRAAGKRQDPYHPLSGEQLARSHDPHHHGSAGRIAGPLHESCPPVAASHGRDRGRRPDRARSRPDGALRGTAAQRASQPDGRIERGCRYPVHPHTNRPEELESALAGRPGRIDQAIEVPLPDAFGRKKLVQLYGSGLPLGDAVVGEAAQRTKGVSAAFIKELMRRIAQASIARDGGTSVESGDISEALDDMLFAGGKLNVKLLGGAQETVDG